MVLEPCLSPLASVLGVIVLLKDNILRSFSPMLQAILQVLLHNAHIKVCIHPSINPACKSNTFPAHTAPHHQVSSSKLDCSIHQPATKSLSCLLPHPLPPI